MTQEHIKECCYDYGKVPYEIHDNYGEGIVGKEYYTTKEERPRKVNLVINSFRGISWDAVHYYGTLKVFAPHVRKEGELGCFCGYLGEDTPLFKDLDIVIELWRYVTEEDRKIDPHRYDEDMKVTNGWSDKTAIIEFAKEVFKARFIGEWKLVIEDYTEK